MTNIKETVDTLRQTLDLITTAQAILDGFNHRNKNQHRLSKWWAEFSTLRRNHGKLAPEIQANLEKQERFAKYRKQPQKGGLDGDTRARVEHIQAHLLPKAFS